MKAIFRHSFARKQPVQMTGQTAGLHTKAATGTALATAPLLSLLLWLPLTSVPANAADTVSDMHDALKERWYTTEIIVFRSNAAPGGQSQEATLLAGEKISAAEERQRTGLQPEPLESENDDQNDNEADADIDGIGRTTLAEPAPEATNRFNEPRAVEVEQGTTLKQRLATETGTETEIERPELDAVPWERIKDYDAADDLGELVARNMATWETQLRDNEGQWLPVDQLTLIDEAERLSKNRNIEVLLHTAWTQAVPDRDSGRPIEVAAGDSYIDNLSGDMASRLSGEITVTLGRYLHVHPTLYFTPVIPEFDADQEQPALLSLRPGAGLGENDIVEKARAAAAAARSQSPLNRPRGRVPEVRDLSSDTQATQRSGRSALDRIADRQNEPSDGLTNNNQFDQRGELTTNDELSDQGFERPAYIRLDESRRVRSGELHYLDHPQLGVLVRITPVVADPLLQEQFALLQ